MYVDYIMLCIRDARRQHARRKGGDVWTAKARPGDFSAVGRRTTRVHLRVTPFIPLHRTREPSLGLVSFMGGCRWFQASHQTYAGSPWWSATTFSLCLVYARVELGSAGRIT